MRRVLRPRPGNKGKIFHLKNFFVKQVYIVNLKQKFCIDRKFFELIIFWVLRHKGHIVFKIALSRTDGLLKSITLNNSIQRNFGSQ